MSPSTTDYTKSRRAFRSSVEAHKGQLLSFCHPSELTDDGDPLTIDVASFGSSDARKLFLCINGTHGNEAEAGGAAQIDLIQSAMLDELGPDTKAVLIHNVNPYGWLHDTQLNENGVNLNRNFLDFENLGEGDPLHYEIENAFGFDELSFGALEKAWEGLELVADKFGRARFDRSLMGGQTIAPRSINYGGTEPQWSNLVLRELARDTMAGVQKVALLDWHTGLGSYGERHELPLVAMGSPEWEETCKWWGREAVDRGLGGVGGEAASGDAIAAAVFEGLAYRAFADANPDARFAGGIVEFGTVQFKLMFQACILDLWLAHESLEDHPEYRFWKNISCQALTPADPVWTASVAERARDISLRTMRGLIDWK